MIIGGQAVLLYGEPRLTKDIDITLTKIEDFVKETMVFPAIDDQSGIRVEEDVAPLERKRGDEPLLSILSVNRS